MFFAKALSVFRESFLFEMRGSFVGVLFQTTVFEHEEILYTPCVVATVFVVVGVVRFAL